MAISRLSSVVIDLVKPVRDSFKLIFIFITSSFPEIKLEFGFLMSKRTFSLEDIVFGFS